MKNKKATAARKVPAKNVTASRRITVPRGHEAIVIKPGDAIPSEVLMRLIDIGSLFSQHIDSNTMLIVATAGKKIPVKTLVDMDCLPDSWGAEQSTNKRLATPEESINTILAHLCSFNTDTANAMIEQLLSAHARRISSEISDRSAYKESAIRDMENTLKATDEDLVRAQKSKEAFLLITGSFANRQDPALFSR